MAAVLSVGVRVDMSAAGKLSSELSRKRVASKAIKKGMKPVVSGAKSRAAKKSGALKKSIGSKSFASKKTKTGAVGVVGARAKVAQQIQAQGKEKRADASYYAHLVEFGTRAHSLAKGSKLARKNKPEQRDIGQGVGAQHPGATAKPFLKPAWDSTQAQVGEIVATEMVKEVEKEIKRNAKTAFKKLR